MRTLFCVLLIVLLSACTTTHIYRTDGINKFEASNTSIGWDRENIDLSLSKKLNDIQVGVKIGKSGGSESFNRGIEFLELAIEAFRGSSGP